jgi:hypothetical protein
MAKSLCNLLIVFPKEFVQAAQPAHDHGGGQSMRLDDGGIGRQGLGFSNDCEPLLDSGGEQCLRAIFGQRRNESFKKKTLGLKWVFDNHVPCERRLWN